jgi:hypothetical protein
MTIETEQSKTISNEQLLNDIRLTGLEIEAYQKLATGFIMLADLPENIQSGRSHLYIAEWRKYSRLESECVDALRKLHALKVERGV